ncbi:hypothetical protein H0J73_004860, partial [Salmonella enterica]|nr:hypothetical protein [Salmonella enterica]
MSENNYGALMLKSALDISVDVTKITSPGIYPIIHGNASVPDASSGLLKVSLTPSKPQITFQKENSSVVYSFVNGNWEKPTATDVDALAKSQNGSDIPDKKQFARNIGAAVAFSGGIAIGGDANPWTTAEFIVWLESQGAFNHPYWMCKGSWSYAENKVITDTGCGNICLAGAVIEVMGVRGAMTIRVTTPTTTSGGGVASAQFTYIDNGEGYSPGWRRDFNTINKPTAGDVGALPITGGRINGALGIGTDNALGGNSIVFGDNDTGFKWHSDGVLGIYANNALVGYIDNSGLHMSVDVLSNGVIRAGNAKKLSLTSNNNSTMTATFNLWGDANRPTVIELDDDQGWHLYSQRNPDGSIVFTVNGDITANTLRAGEAIYQNNGDIFGSAWGGWL